MELRVRNASNHPTSDSVRATQEKQRNRIPGVLVVLSPSRMHVRQEKKWSFSAVAAQFCRGRGPDLLSPQPPRLMSSLHHEVRISSR